MNKILILGGYGNFGKRIARALTKDNIPIIIAGRNAKKAQALAAELNAEIAVFDVNKELDFQLKNLKPKIVINTCGPFQNADYSVAQICIDNVVHYIDLADGRDFVVGISELDVTANKAGVLVVSGASTVPGLSSAVLEKFKDDFSQIDSLQFGITPGQKAERGLATTQGILSYLGKPLKPAFGSSKMRYGWQDIHRQEYPDLGKRWMANCDIPDLVLLPQKYGLKEIQFSAGMENSFLHLSLWLVSWLVRFGLPIKLAKHAKLLLGISRLFDFFGTADGGMHVIIEGKNQQGEAIKHKWFIIAKNGDGPQIPTIPAIVLAKKLYADQLSQRGATPCLAMLSVEEYLHELKDFDIKQYQS